MKNLSNKWTRAAIPALLLHCSIGTVYCWSLFSGPIHTASGLDAAALEWAFSLAIFFLGMSAAFLGNFVEKNIHLASLIAAICFAVGVAGTGLGVRLHSLPLILICYGVIMGENTIFAAPKPATASPVAKPLLSLNQSISVFTGER